MLVVDERCISESIPSPSVFLQSEKSKNWCLGPLGNRFDHISYQASVLLILEFCRSLLPNDQSRLWCKNPVESSSDLNVWGRRRSLLRGVCRSMLVQLLWPHVVSVFWLCLASSPPCMYSTNWWYHSVGCRHHQASSGSHLHSLLGLHTVADPGLILRGVKTQHNSCRKKKQTKNMYEAVSN